MNRKVMLKILSILITAFMVASMFFVPAYAAYTDVDMDVLTGTGSEVANETFSKIMLTIINVIKIVGMGVAIIMLIYIAIKYITASPDGKAEFKKSATGYVVGAIVLFAASGVLQIIQNFASDVVKPAASN